MVSLSRLLLYAALLMPGFTQVSLARGGAINND